VKVALHVDGPGVRGSERQALMVVRGLVARGHAVAASCRADSPVREALERAGARTTGVRPRGDADLVHLAGFVAWLRRERPDALLLTSWVRAFGASLAGRLAGVPRVVLRIGGPQDLPGGLSGWKYRRALLRQVDALIVNSRGLRDRFTAALPDLDPARIHVVHNAVEPLDSPPAPADIDLRSDDVSVIAAAVGVLERNKRHRILLDALARPGLEDVGLVIVGAGSEWGRLEAQVDRLGLKDRVRLLGMRRDVPAVLAAADLFVLPSKRDSLANAMLEAMRAGLPVVATDVPGSADALLPTEERPGRAGWVVPCDDVDALAAALAEAAALVRKGGKAARAVADEARWRAEHWFTPERMVAGYEAVLAGRGVDGAAAG
jgi:glycosyltransferase involved in cell wall biosynthesis